jgi:hypothetical protein
MISFSDRLPTSSSAPSPETRRLNVLYAQVGSPSALPHVSFATPMLASLVFFVLALSSRVLVSASVVPAERTDLSFAARHNFRTYIDADNLRNTLSTIPSVNDDAVPTVTLQAIPTTVIRARDPLVYQDARRSSRRFRQSLPVEWEELTVLAPNVQDQHTLSQLARMTANAYALPGDKNWYNMDPVWNTVRWLCLSLSSQTDKRYRLFQLVGKIPQTDSVGMSSSRRIIALPSLRSKELQFRVLRVRRTSSTTTFFSAVVAHASIRHGHGRQCAIATPVIGDATRSA